MQSIEQLWQMAQEQHARNLREAELWRVAELAARANASRPHLARRVLWRLGDGLAFAGARLTAGRPTADWQLKTNTQSQ